ncbi:MAG TPA: hypothetical protein HPP80_04900 [Rhodospirillaceae bacterium]|nr:hypothetical protein [Rhodospirillaceae bacterium]
MMRSLIFCCALLGLAACTAATLPATVMIDGASVVNTEKTLDDHLASWFTGKDCSTVRASLGEKYCEEPPAFVPKIERTTYCYKSLAAVSCYDQPVQRDAARLFGTRSDQVPAN